MKNFIRSNKKFIILFLIFLSVAMASRIYIIYYVKNQLKSVSNLHQTAAVNNQNAALEQALNVLKPSEGKGEIEQKNTRLEQSPDSSGSTSPAPSEIINPDSISEKHIFYVINKKYEIAMPQNSTVYELMNLLKQQGDFDFQGKESSGLGFFVEEINGVKNNPTENTFWIYYINNKPAEVGISNYILKPNDIINWKYEKPQF